MSHTASSRRCPPLAICLAAVALLAGSPAAAANLIPNPSVETVDPANKDRPEGWLTDVWGGVQASFQYLQSGADGARSLRVEVTAKTGEGDAKWWSKPFAVPPGGGLYQVRDSYRSSVQSELLVQIFDGAGGSDWLTVKVVPAVSGWGQATGAVSLPPGTTSVRVAHVITVPGWLETDSYAMEARTSSDGGVTDGGVGDARSSDGGRRDVSLASKGALVSVVFDDGWASVYTFARPILKERGLRASHYIIADFVGKPGYQSDYMVADQITELSYLGHEIGSHSLDHQDMTEVDNLSDEVVGSKRALEKLGFQVTGFVPPGGAFNDEVLELVKANYGYMRTVEEGLNAAPYDVYHLKCVIPINTTPLSEIAAWVQQAAAEKSWLILLYHRLGFKADYDTFVTSARFKEDMDYLVASGADVRPIGEVLGLWKPAQPPPPVETGKSLPPLDGGNGCSAAPSAPSGGEAGLAGLAVVLLLLLLLVAHRECAAFPGEPETD